MPNQSSRARLTEFLRTELAAGAALVAATAVALLWANLAPGTYHDVWSTTISLPGPGRELTLEEWVTSGLMAIFFFVVALEIKREIVDGELRDPRIAAIPVIGALGGMVVPAGIYLVITAGSGLGHGWGIPMATDIAFALGILRVFGRRAPRALGLTLLTRAIVDDLGSFVVVALFYSSGVRAAWLLAAAGIALAVLTLGRRFEHPVWFVLPAVALWIALYRSGVPATLAGVALAFLTPLRTRRGRPVLTALEHSLHPWGSFVVVPLFALANAGIVISSGTIGHALGSEAALGIVAGRVVGKVAGIALGVALARRLGARTALDRRCIAALGFLGGIGLTVSVFVADLSFSGVDLDTAKLAILAGSVVAAVLAAGVLRTIRPVPDADA
ncbi:MAG: Na+/H+ antiporter NhaA [Acidimicrobiia bacterium]